MRRHQQLLLRRFFFHVTFVFVALVVLLLGLRLIWGWEAGVRLARVQREVVARGLSPGVVPVHRMIPDDGNAATAYLEALRRMRVNPQDTFFRNDPRSFQLMREMRWPLDMTRARATLDANAECFKWMQQVVDRRDVEWVVDMQASREDLDGMSVYAASVQMRRLLRVKIQVCHSQHEDGEVLRVLGELLAMGRVMEANPDFYSQLAASLMRADAMQVIERLAPELEIAPGDVPNVRAIMAQLNEECPHSDRIVSVFESTTLTTPDAVLKERPSLEEWWLRPLATEGTARRIALQLQLLPIAHTKNWQEVARISLPPAVVPTTLNTVVVSLSDPPIGIVDVMEYYFRSLSDSRASAVMLAARLYQEDHKELPPTMASLVPGYLSVEPADPFSGTGEAMHYRVDADGVTIWSVGENGVDDHGPAPVPSFVTPGLGGRYAQLDIVYGAGARSLYSRPAPSR